MNARRVAASQFLSQLVHGKPSLPRSQQPCMFSILSWVKQARSPTIHGNAEQQNPQVQIPKSTGKSKEKNINKSLQKQNKAPIVQPSPGKNTKETQYKVDDSSDQNVKGSSIQGKQFKSNLYSIERVKLKKSRSQEEKKTKTSFHQPQKKQQPVVKKRLDENNQDDKKVIEQRKQRIKDFMLVTRDLPNSASTTYFGRPPFQAYGRGKSVAQLKTFNIMPQRGDNHPRTVQCYISALIKGKKLTGTSNYIPRKALTICKEAKNEEIANSQKPINLPLEKPDLINHIRFSCQEPVKNKQGIPKQNKTLNSQRTNPNTSSVKKQGKTKKSKLHKSQTMINVNDGLKFMNKRDNLLSLLEEKKMKSSKLAYKVTECYPLPWSFDPTCKTNLTIAEWQQVKPAGRQYPVSDHAKDVFKFETKEQLKQTQLIQEH